MAMNCLIILLINVLLQSSILPKKKIKTLSIPIFRKCGLKHSNSHTTQPFVVPLSQLALQVVRRSDCPIVTLTETFGHSL